MILVVDAHRWVSQKAKTRVWHAAHHSNIAPEFLPVSSSNTKGISENSLDVHIESIFRMSWSLLLLVPSPCRICHLLIRGDMCGFSFPLFSPLAAALGFSLSPRRVGKRRTENLFRKHCFLCVLPISCNPNLDGYLEKFLELEIGGSRN